MAEAQIVHVDTETGEVVQPVTLFGTVDPAEIADAAAAKAAVLKKVVDQAGLAKRFGRDGREFITLEGWTFLGSMFGVFASVEWSRPIVNASNEVYGWEARAEARTLEGRLVGAAEAMCTIGERNWSNRDQYAVRSMAQTRAISKALRMPLSFVTVLAGYEATPADEVPDKDDDWGSPPTAGKGNEGPAMAPAEGGEGSSSRLGGDSDDEPSTLEPATPEQWARLLALADVGGSQPKALNRINRYNQASYTKATVKDATVAEVARAITGG
jgi:hypothetical protein